MRRFLFMVYGTISVLVSLISCNEPVSQTWQKGDLVFVGIPAENEYVTEKTIYIHASIIDVDDEGVWILDATNQRGVDRYPIASFVSEFKRHDGSFPSFEVMRLKDTAGVSSFVEDAKKYIGEKYDLAFEPGNGAHYCTELVYDSYIIDGTHIFDAYDMDFKDESGEYPAFWVRTFKKLGAAIPQGKWGTVPRVMRSSDALLPVGYIDPSSYNQYGQ